MYTYELNPNTPDSHQVSPSYVLTFIRWEERDTKNNSGTSTYGTRKPLVVYNDAVSVTVTQSKSSTPTMSAILVSGDINYSTAIHTGDFVLVNMVNDNTKADNIVDRIYNDKPINKFKDGFKGLFKIQQVTRSLKVLPSGVKSYSYSISAAAFTELNSLMMYHPAMAQEVKGKPAAVAFNILFGEFFTGKGVKVRDAGENIIDLYAMLLGHSCRSDQSNLMASEKPHYILPQYVSSLLGRKNKKYLNEIYNLLVGIWGKSSANFTTPQSGLTDGFQPYSTSNGNIFVGRTFSVKGAEKSALLQGWYVLNPQDWHLKTVKSVFEGYMNPQLNEMYTTFKIDAQTDAVVPTLIFRQKPFNNLTFSGDVPSSPFEMLPRWKLSPDLTFSFSFSKNESLRHNLVQMYTRRYDQNSGTYMAQQIADGNYVLDEIDINRHGVRPYIQSSDADYPSTDITTSLAKEWTNLIADWVMNVHLKESGTIQTVGIEEPISVGDNLEFDGVVYHIESITHQFQITQQGQKVFRTSFNLSYGVDTRSTKLGTIWTEMEYTDRHTKGQQDFRNNKILPGVSDTQDILGRVQGEEVTETKEKPFQFNRLKR